MQTLKSAEDVFFNAVRNDINNPPLSFECRCEVTGNAQERMPLYLSNNNPHYTPLEAVLSAGTEAS